MGKILIACEESQAVTKEFRKLGHEAFSCDILPCSGGHPEWHLQQDVTELLRRSWNLIVAFPPCTYLTVSGNRWFNVDRYGEKAVQRHKDRKEAIKFFLMFANADCDYIAIENPIGIMSSAWIKPDQIIQPWMFGHGETKATCLWLRGLPMLEPSQVVDGRQQHIWKMPPSPERSKLRSKTFPGIAKAMAEQWGNLIK